MKGGKLSSQDLQHFLKKSYDTKHSDYKDFVLDKGLSGQRVQVYQNPKTNQAVVVHRGTKGLKDWMTDARYAMGDTSSSRFKHSAKIQKQAEDKYGANNVSSIGHSIGSQLAEKSSSKKVKEIITLNKPVNTKDLIWHTVPKNQTDIRTTLDPVSILRTLERGKQAVVLPSQSFNPLTEHSTEILNQHSPTLYGSGFSERCQYII